MRFSQESESNEESDKVKGRRTGWLDVMSAEQHVQDQIQVIERAWNR